MAMSILFTEPVLMTEKGTPGGHLFQSPAPNRAEFAHAAQGLFQSSCKYAKDGDSSVPLGNQS